MTAVWPTWIEALTGLDPDGGNGALEWLVVVVFGVVGVASGLLARHHFRPARSVVLGSAPTDATTK
jgi:hypothetical protein